jgi:toxin ParE1/3/4
MKLEWTHPARDDVLEIIGYIAQDDPAAADRVGEAIIEAVGKLSDFPQIGRDGIVPGTRELVLPRLPYIISYRVARQGVQILAVLHSARDRRRVLGEASGARGKKPAPK